MSIEEWKGRYNGRYSEREGYIDRERVIESESYGHGEEDTVHHHRHAI